MNLKRPVSFSGGEIMRRIAFYRMAEGLEDVKEGGARCFKCYALRLRETAQMAKKAGYDYFTTTLSISPMKNAAKLNEIGLAAQKEFGVKYLQSDFKKKTDTNDPLSYPKNMDCIGRITAVVSFHKEAVHNRAETVHSFLWTYNTFNVLN